MQVLYLGRAPRTKETLPDFLKWRRVTRPPLVFRGLTSSQRTLGFWGVTLLLLLLLLPFSSFLSSPFLLLPLRPKMRYLFLVLSLFVLIPFLFHFPRRKLPPSFLQATCLFHNFSSLFHYNIFFYYPLVLTFIFILIQFIKILL